MKKLTVYDLPKYLKHPLEFSQPNLVNKETKTSKQKKACSDNQDYQSGSTWSKFCFPNQYSSQLKQYSATP